MNCEVLCSLESIIPQGPGKIQAIIGQLNPLRHMSATIIEVLQCLGERIVSFENDFGKLREGDEIITISPTELNPESSSLKELFAFAQEKHGFGPLSIPIISLLFLWLRNTDKECRENARFYIDMNIMPDMHQGSFLYVREVCKRCIGERFILSSRLPDDPTEVPPNSSLIFLRPKNSGK